MGCYTRIEHLKRDKTGIAFWRTRQKRTLRSIQRSDNLKEQRNGNWTPSESANTPKSATGQQRIVKRRRKNLSRKPRAIPHDCSNRTLLNLRRATDTRLLATVCSARTVASPIAFPVRTFDPRRATSRQSTLRGHPSPGNSSCAL